MINNTIKYVDIIRHAQSESNAGLPVNDPASVKLTELGRRQAQAVSESFNELNPPQLIVTSPFIRTGETAAPTIARFPQAQREVWPIQEVTYLDPSKYKGTTFAQRKPFTRPYWEKADPDYIDGPGAESFNQMMARVDDMLGRIRQLPHDYTVIFCHGFIMRAAWQRLANPQLKGPDLMRAVKSKRITGDLPNTGRIRLAVQDGAIQIVPGWSSLANVA
jgi:broad specificity phosphatase PhoE